MIKNQNFKKALVLGLGLFLFQNGFASDLPPLLRELQIRYLKQKTILADFTQETESAKLKTKSKSQGVIWIKLPNLIRWETKSPDKNLLVSNGEKFWFYTPPFIDGEHGQLIERKASEIKTKFLNALLSGNFQSKDLKVENGKKEGEFLLTPKKGTAGSVKTALVLIDPKKVVLTEVRLEHWDGNKATLQLTAIEVGKPLEDQLFRFIAPPNTDRVD